MQNSGLLIDLLLCYKSWDQGSAISVFSQALYGLIPISAPGITVLENHYLL